MPRPRGFLSDLVSRRVRGYQRHSRFLVGDQPQMAAESHRLVDAAEAGGLQLHISHLVIAEVVWILTSQYRRTRSEVVQWLLRFLDLRSVRVDQREMLRNALRLFEANNIDYIDAYHVVDCQRRGLSVICSYDQDFDRVSANRIEPGALVGAS